MFLRSPKCQQHSHPSHLDTWTTSFSWYTAEISGLAFQQDACLIFLYHVCRTLYIQSLISSLNGWGQFDSCQEFMIFLQPTSCYYACLCLDLTEILLSCMQSCHLCSQCTHYPQTLTQMFASFHRYEKLLQGMILSVTGIAVYNLKNSEMVIEMFVYSPLNHLMQLLTTKLFLEVLWCNTWIPIHWLRNTVYGVLGI